MNIKVTEIIDELSSKCAHLPQPIHIIAIHSGGTAVGKHLLKYFRAHKIESDYFEARTDIVGNKTRVRIVDFGKEDYTGTALIAEDVVWQGNTVSEVKKILKQLNPKKAYLAVLLDMNNKADFSIFN